VRNIPKIWIWNRIFVGKHQSFESEIESSCFRGVSQRIAIYFLFSDVNEREFTVTDGRFRFPDTDNGMKHSQNLFQTLKNNEKQWKTMKNNENNENFRKVLSSLNEEPINF
jgi:hypothetical protein